MAKKNQTKSTLENRTFEIPKLEEEVLLFFEHLKRKSPEVFKIVTPSFVSESLAEFEESHNKFNADSAAHAEAVANAKAESEHENNRIEALRQQRAQKVIDDARAKVEAEDKQLRDAINQRQLKEEAVQE